MAEAQRGPWGGGQGDEQGAKRQGQHQQKLSLHWKQDPGLGGRKDTDVGTTRNSHNLSLAAPLLNISSPQPTFAHSASAPTRQHVTSHLAFRF